MYIEHGVRVEDKQTRKTAGFECESVRYCTLSPIVTK